MEGERLNETAGGSEGNREGNERKEVEEEGVGERAEFAPFIAVVCTRRSNVHGCTVALGAVRASRCSDSQGCAVAPPP